MTKVIAVIMAIFTWFGAVLNPGWCKTEGIFGDVEERIQTVFDEGEFVMGENDLVVAPYGNDSNSGTLEAPLKTLEKAKDILKSDTNGDPVTVWFREGTYTINETVEFTAEDRGNVLYRSYPGEKVSFSG